MTPEGYYEMGDVVEVIAWWNGDRHMVCDVIKDQCYLNAFTDEMVVAKGIDVRPRGLKGAHTRYVSLKDVLGNIQSDSIASQMKRCSCGVAIKSLADFQIDFHKRAGHILPEAKDATKDINS
jgi:hypothetical protein